MAGGRVDHHPHGLVHHDDILVLVDHIQGDVLGEDLHLRGVGDEDGDLVPLLELVVLFQGLAAPEDMTGLQKLLGGGPGEVIQGLGQELVSPDPILLGNEGDVHVSSSFVSSFMVSST